MATEVILPKVDMVMETGTFVEWLKQEGETVEKGQPLFVIMTDKAAIEVEAPASGILAGVSAKAEDVIPVSQTIAYILQPGEKLPASVSPRPMAAASPASLPKVPEMAVAVEAQDGKKGDAGAGKVRATPVARRMAAELGVDLASVHGRGPQGRIHRADVLEAAEKVAEPVVAARLYRKASRRLPCKSPCRTPGGKV